jgi:cytidylate kinase
VIITIDGPAGSGKSTVARGVARRLGMTYLDTGAMYRAVTVLALERGISAEDADGLSALALEMDLRFEPAGEREPRVLIDGRDMTAAIRESRVTQTVSLVAAHAKVRQALTLHQRDMSISGNTVLEGRDTGTVVCPTADLKIYLTASIEERARRRQEQLAEQGIEVPLKTLERELLLRDTTDAGRPVAPLRRSREAVEIDTTSMSAEEVITRICELAARSGTTDAR